EVRVVPALGDLLGGGRDGLGGFPVEHPQLFVDPGSRGLEQAEGADLRAVQTTPGYRKVLHGPLGLGPPQRVNRNPHVTHGVVLQAILSLCHASSLTVDSSLGIVACSTY